MVTNTKNGQVIEDYKVRSKVTGHFLDCNEGIIFTTWMEVFAGDFGTGKYTSQVPAMMESQTRNASNGNLFDELCK